MTNVFVTDRGLGESYCVASDKLLTQTEFADAMGISRETASRWILKGMPAVKIHGRRYAINLREAKAWLHARHGPELTALPGEKFDAPASPPPIPFETPDPSGPVPDLTAPQLQRAYLESQIARNRQQARKAEIFNRRASAEWMPTAKALRVIGETQHTIRNQLRFGAPELAELLVGKSRDEMVGIIREHFRELLMDCGVTLLGELHERSWHAYEHATGQPPPVNMDEDGNAIADLDDLDEEDEADDDDEA